MGLIIEIDGSSHGDKEGYDNTRQIYLESLSLEVYRIDDVDVKSNINGVMMALEEYIIEKFK